MYLADKNTIMILWQLLACMKVLFIYNFSIQNCCYIRAIKQEIMNASLIQDKKQLYSISLIVIVEALVVIIQRNHYYSALLIWET